MTVEHEPESAEESLAPSLLIAMPQMSDPNFERSVVLLCEHGTQGTMGLVINRPTETLVTAIVDLDPAPRPSDLAVWIGGPVETNRGWILTAVDPGTSDRISVADGLYLAASKDALRWCLDAPPATQLRTRFLLGYAGWAPSQLESELAASAWLNAPVRLDLLFDLPSEKMWDAAVRSLGIDPVMLQMGPGIH